MDDAELYTEKGESESCIPSAEPGESVSELQVRLENCEKRYNDLKAQNTELHNKTVDLTTHLDQKREEIRRLREQIESANTGVIRLQGQLDSERQKVAECREIAEKLRSQNVTLAREKEMHDEEKEQLKEKIKNLENGVETYRKDNQNLENVLKSQMEKYRYRIQELEEKNRELERDVNEKGRSLTACQEVLGTWEKEKRQLETTIEDLNEKVRVYKAYLEDFKKLYDEISRQSKPEKLPKQESSIVEPEPAEKKRSWDLDDEDVLLQL